MAALDDLRPRIERTRRSVTMLPPHATATLSREEVLDLLALVQVLADQAAANGPRPRA
jgi:hypothetical protein